MCAHCMKVNIYACVYGPEIKCKELCKKWMTFGVFLSLTHGHTHARTYTHSL